LSYMYCLTCSSLHNVSIIVCCCRRFDAYLHENELSTVPPFIVASEIDYARKVVHSYFMNKAISKLVGFTASAAVYLGPKLGCQLRDSNRLDNRTVDGFNAHHRNVQSSPRVVSLDDCVNGVVQRDFTPEGHARNHTRATVVIHQGRIVGEGYMESAGITRDTRLLGWSMTKSAHAAIVGAAIQAGLLNLSTPVKLPDLDSAQRAHLYALNGNQSLTFGDLLQMKDVLRIEEKYGIFDDITTMLYGHPDAGQYASQRTAKEVGAPKKESRKDSTFGWYYSSGVSNLLARELRDLFSSEGEYLDFPHSHLFSRIGADSFAIELDGAGTFVASSFGYATARDWARLGELFLNNGTWNGEQILPADFVEFVQQPHPHSGGHYGGQFWLNPSRVSVAEYNQLPHEHVEKRRKVWMTQVLPPDAYAMNGYLGQSTMIIPSRDTVIVRLGYTPEVPPGLTPKWDPQVFYGDILACLPE
jgi:CubicO group peptidase (beta-lactamase class C family)